jgi:hypothetical protein
MDSRLKFDRGSNKEHDKAERDGGTYGRGDHSGLMIRCLMAVTKNSEVVFFITSMWP